MTNKMYKMALGGVLLAAFLGLGGQAADRIGANALDVGDLAEPADLIFQGAVTKIEHKVAQAGNTSLPFTFVTYQVDEALKGKPDGKTITLRFVGGPTGKEGQFLSVDGLPSFNVGDQDILFVTGNGEQGIPLVGKRDGRFRIVENEVVTDEGFQVMRGGEGRLTIGAQTRPEVAVMRIRPTEQQVKAIQDRLAKGNVTPQQRKEAEEYIKNGAAVRLTPTATPQRETPDAVRDPEARPVTIEKPRGTAFRVADFKSLITTEARRRPGKPRPFVSADPSKPISFTAPAPKASPRAVADKVEVPANESDADKQERELFEKGGGNPVIKKP